MKDSNHLKCHMSKEKKVYKHFKAKDKKTHHFM